MPTDVSTPHPWDERRSLVKQNDPHAGQLNSIFNQRPNHVQGLAYIEIGKNPNVSADDIKYTYLGKDRKDFWHRSPLLSRSEAKGSIGTHDKNLSVIKKLRAYVK